MSAVHSLGIIPEVVAGYIVVIAYMLIAMAMAGLGLNVEFKTFRKLGSRAFVAGLIGSVCLICSWVCSCICVRIYVVRRRSCPNRYFGTASFYAYSATGVDIFKKSPI